MKTIFNVCCPSQAAQYAMFQNLLGRDELQACPITALRFTHPSDKFFCFAEGFNAITDAIREVRSSTNPIFVADGVFSDLFLRLEELDLSDTSSSVTKSFFEFMKQVLSQVRIVHLFLRTHEGDNTRRTALTTLWQRQTGTKNELWFFYDADVDPARVSKQIMECVKKEKPEEEEG